MNPLLTQQMRLRTGTSGPLRGQPTAPAVLEASCIHPCSLQGPVRGMQPLLRRRTPCLATTPQGAPPAPSPTSHTSSSSRGKWRQHAQRQLDHSSSSEGEHDPHDPHSSGDAEEGPDVGVDDLWAPQPPTPALGRKRKVAVLIGAALLEISMTGALVWSPLLCAVLLAVMQPTKAEIQQQQEEAVKQAVAAAEVSAYRHLPVTPVEGAAWLNRLNQDMWAAFWQPFLLANNLSSWQDTVSAAAPKGWEVEIADVSIGTLAPQLSGFQAFADPDSGAVTAVDASMAFNSSSVRLVVVGRGPLGAFTAKVSAVQMEGQLRITPLLQHRMLLVAFKAPPAVRVSLSLSAPLFRSALSPGDLGQLNFIQGLIGSAIKDQMVEPRRIAVSLDSEIRVEQAVSTTLHLSIDSITGLPRSAVAGAADAAAAAAAGGAAGVSGGRGSERPASRVALMLVDTTTQVRRSSRAVAPSPLRRSAAVGQVLSLELRRKQGLFRLEVREVVPGPGGRVSVSRGTLLGSCLLWVAAARDGTTLFWTYDRSGAPLATRWSPLPSPRPWQLSLPLTPSSPGAQALAVTLGVSVDPWLYKAGLGLLPGAGGVGAGALRSPGPRVVLLQVVEARGLVGVSSSGRGPTTHIQVAYGQDIYRTTTQYGTHSPIYTELFAFPESSSTMANRIKLEVWQDDATVPAAAAGGGGSSSKPHNSSSSGSSSGSYRRVLVPSSRRVGAKAINRLRHSSGSSSSSSSSSSSKGGGSGGGKGGSSSSRSSSVASYQLSDVEPESEAAEPDSHMLVDLELQDEQQQQQQREEADVAVDSSSSSSSSSSGSGDGSVSVSLGSTSIELDQLSEALVQDRWFELGGAGGVQVRVRLAVVPGTLPAAAAAAAAAKTSSRRAQTPRPDAAAAGGAGGGGKDVLTMLGFFQQQAQGSSRDSVLVEVVSARLYLPLSSMDSSDIDQPAYVLSFGGNATVTTPPHGRPARSRPASRTSSSSSSSSGGGTAGGTASAAASGGWSRPSGGASRGARSPTLEQQQPTAAAGGSSAVAGLFEGVRAGNVSQQVAEETCLARAVFPLYAAGNGAGSAGDPAADAGVRDPAAAAAAAAAGGLSSRGTSPGPPGLLKVLLFDPEEIQHASPAAAAAAFAAAAASSTSSRAVTPSDTSSSSGSSQVVSGDRGGSSGRSSPLASHPIAVRQDSSDSGSSSSSALSDIGGVEVDVHKLLLLAAARRGSPVNGSGSNGSSSGGSDGGSDGSSGAAASWEGWVKLDKDGGHLLLRLTHLPAAAPADLVPPIAPPPPPASTSSSSSGSGPTAERIAAAAAAVAGPAGAAAAAAGGGGADGSGSSSGGVEGLVGLLKQGWTQAEGQVSGATQQLNEATAAVSQWLNSTTPSWLNPWAPRSSSSSSSSGSTGKQQRQPTQQQQPQPQQQQPGEAGQQAGPAASSSAAQPAGQAAAAPADSAALQLADTSQQQQQQQQDQGFSFGVDLRFISRALGVGGGGSSSGSSGSKRTPPQGQQSPTAGSKQQQQQRPSAAAQAQQQQQQQPEVQSHPLPDHALRDTEATAAAAAAAEAPAAPAASAAAAAPGQAGSGPDGVGAAQELSRGSSNGTSSSSSQGAPDHPPPTAAAATTQGAKEQSQAGSAGGLAAGSAAAAATAAAAAAAASGLQSHALPAGAAADVWSYDGFGDAPPQQQEEEQDEF